MARCSALAVAALVLALVPAAARAEPPPATIAPAAPDVRPPPIPPVPPRLADDPDYQHCLDMLPDDPTGAYAFADAWFATGGGPSAQQCQALAAIALGDPQSGAGLLEQAVAASQAPNGARAAVLGQAMQAWLMADDPARAFDAASKAIELDPGNPNLFVDRSIAAATMERYLDAIDDLNRALVLDPDRVDALTFRAAAWRNEGKLAEARADIDRAVALAPDNPEALLERGIERQRANDEAGARADWERARALAPDSATADLAEQNLALLEAGPVPRK